MYHASLQQGHYGGYGFVLGNLLARRIDFALAVASLTLVKGLNDAPGQLDADMHAAKEVARFAESDLIGVFLATAPLIGEEPGATVRDFVAYATNAALSCVVEAPIEGGDTFWRWKILLAPNFSEQHNYLPAGRRSFSPRHNPRRVLALWRQLRLHEIS